MNKSIGVNAAIKTIRFMAFMGIILAVICCVEASSLLLGSLSSISTREVYVLISIPLGILGCSLQVICNVFRSQQSEIDDLRAAIQLQQSADELAKVE